MNNLQAKIIEIRHSELERYGDGNYKSECPVCKKGTLLVRRNPDMSLCPVDNCVRCGQFFKYLDDTINGEKVVDTRPCH